MDDEQQAAVRRVTDALDVPPDARDLARAFAHRAVEADLHERRSTESVVASAVYAACRREGAPRTLDETTAVAETDRTSIGRTYRLLVHELDLDIEPADPNEFVTRFAEPFSIDDPTERLAHEIVTETVEAGLTAGCAPAGVAAGALYLADCEQHQRLTQREVAAVADVSPITVRHRYTEQAQLLGLTGYGKPPRSRENLIGTE